MPAWRLNRYFARRMLPLAIFAGLVVAGVPPTLYRVLVWQRLGTQAGIYARHIAENARDAAFHQPYLWRFNIEKIIHATALHLEQDDIASIEITDCADVPFFSSDPSKHTRKTYGLPSGTAPVIVRGQTTALVGVHIDPEQYNWALWVTAMVSIPLGVTMGLLLFLFPTGVVRRQSMHLSEMMDELQSAKQELVQTNLDLTERVEEGVQKVRALSQRVVQTQEDERQRIARDLHDELGHAIANIQMEAEIALAHPEETDKHLRGVSQGCEAALKSLRRVVRELRPVELESQSLLEVIRSYAEDFEQRSGITTYFRCRGSIELPPQQALCLLRTLREALTNAARYANAHEVGIRLTLGSPIAALEVADDGNGFDPAAPTRGTGLLGMRERCELLGGNLTVETAPGQGTTIKLELPTSRLS